MSDLHNIKPLRNNILEQLSLSNIHFSIMDGNYHYFIQSLKNEDVLNILDKNQCSLLHYAVFYKRIIMIHDLIKKGINIDFKNTKGCTALHYACGSDGDDNIAIMLKKYGADPFTKDIYDYTPLEYALFNDNEKLFNALCK